MQMILQTIDLKNQNTEPNFTRKCGNWALNCRFLHQSVQTLLQTINSTKFTSTAAFRNIQKPWNCLQNHQNHQNRIIHGRNNINRLLKLFPASIFLLFTFWVFHQNPNNFSLLHGHDFHGEPFLWCLVFSPTPNICFFNPFLYETQWQRRKTIYTQLCFWNQISISLDDPKSKASSPILTNISRTFDFNQSAKVADQILATAAKAEAEQIRTAGPLDREIGWISRSRR